MYLILFGFVHFGMFIGMRNAYIPCQAYSYNFKNMVTDSTQPDPELFEKVFLDIDDARDETPRDQPQLYKS